MEMHKHVWRERIWPLFWLYGIFAPFMGFLLFASCARAEASPFDPHVPDITRNHCPGGFGGGFGFTYCDGLPFDDGSFWHQLQGSSGRGFFGMNVAHEFNCVTDMGNPIPPRAPAGACGGEWQG